MKTRSFEIVCKVVWILVILFAMNTLIHVTYISVFLSRKFTIWNFVVPNLLTLGILIIYTKELLIGYYPRSKSETQKSLFFFAILLLTLIIIQRSQFEFLFTGLDDWQMTLFLIVILTSYIGILLNRVLKLKKINSLI